MSRSRAHGRKAIHRTRAGLVVAAGVAGVVLLGGAAPKQTHPAPPALAAASVPAADATSSTWVCAGLRAGSRSAVVLEDRTDHAVTGVLEVVGTGRVLHVQAVGVAAHGRAVLSVVLPRRANYAGAIVRLDGGGVLVSETLHWNGLLAAAPCGSSTSTMAAFADAVSTRHTSSVVTIVNPSTTAPAVVSITAITPTGVVEPAPLQGIVVPPSRCVAVDLATSVLNQATFAAQVTAVAGRIVAAEDELGWGRNRILTILPGQPSLSGRNLLGDEVKHAGQGQLLTVTNFSSTPATASIQATLPSGVLRATSITVPSSTIVGVSIATLAGVPQDFPFTIVVTARAGAIAAARIDQVWDGVALWRSAEVATEVDAATAVALLPSPSSADAGARWHTVVVTNVAGRPNTVRLERTSPTGLVSLGAPFRLGVGQVVVVESGPAVDAAARGSLIVATGTGPVVLAGRAIPQRQPTGQTAAGVPAA